MPKRMWLRYGLVLLGGFLAGGRVVDATRAWREWHQSAATDPSAADLYRTDFWIDVAMTIAIVGVTGIIHWLLRPRSDTGAVRSHVEE